MSITDDGPGISPDGISHIFDKFYQEDHSHKTDGNGLGLSIVRRIVDLHGGFIQVESQDISATFEVYLRHNSN